MLQYFHEKCLATFTASRQKTLDRIQITQFIRKTLLDIQKTVYVKIKEIEDAK